MKSCDLTIPKHNQCTEGGEQQILSAVNLSANQTILLSAYLPASLSACMYVFLTEISYNVVCATSKGSDQPAHMQSLIRNFACRLYII